MKRITLKLFNTKAYSFFLNINFQDFNLYILFNFIIFYCFYLLLLVWTGNCKAGAVNRLSMIMDTAMTKEMKYG